MDVFIKVKSNEKESYAVVKRMIELGWDGMAWTQTVLGKGGIKVHVKPRSVLELTAIDKKGTSVMRSLAVPSSCCDNFQFKQLNRLNVVVDDIADAQTLSAGNEQFKHFDILSATPGNLQVFTHLCKLADVDIIHIDFTHKTSFPLQKKLIDVAVQRGICFELQYCPALQHSTRPDIFANTQNVVKFLRGRNIILSSGADSSSSLRAPIDAMNIAVLLGLSEDQARQAVFGNVDQVIRHGEARRHRYLPVRVTSMASFEEKCKILANSMVKDKNEEQDDKEHVSKKRKSGKSRKKNKKRSKNIKAEDIEIEDEDEGNEDDGYHIPGSSLVEDTHEDHEENEDFLQF